MTEVPHRDAHSLRNSSTPSLKHYLPSSPTHSTAPSSSVSLRSPRLQRARPKPQSTPNVLNRRASPNANPELALNRASSAPNKPRKRFRKKVSSIFADNTDLKKRVEKLFLDVGTEHLHAIAAAPVQPIKYAPREDTCTLQVPKEALQMLHNLSSSKEAAESRKRMQHHPQFLTNAAKVWGAHAVHKVRKHIENSTPISFEAFVNVFELEQDKENAPLRTAPQHSNRSAIVPPKRVSTQWFAEYARNNKIKQRKAVNRFGLPAILRKNARRNERGYRIDGKARSHSVHTMRRTRKSAQRRVTPRSTDAFQMLVEVATEQNDGEKRKRSLGHLLDYADERGDILPKSLKKRKLRSN